MKARMRWLIPGAALTLLLLLALGGAALFSWDERPAFRLADRSTVYVQEVRYGKTGTFHFGPTWKQRLAPLAPGLPSALASRLTIPEADPEPAIAPGALAVSLSHSGAPELLRPTCDLRDSHGCRYRPMYEVPFTEGGENGNISYFPFFPRREATFRLEVLLTSQLNPFLGTGEDTSAVGGIDLRCPSPKHYPTWKAEALPVTRTSGPLSVTLTGVTTGWSQVAPRRPGAGSDAEFTRLTFHCADASRQWQVAGVSLADPLGGSYRSESWRLVPGVLYVEGDNLCREEPAYRYQLEFSRALTHTAKPDRIYRFPGLRTPISSGNLVHRPMMLPDGRQLTLDYHLGAGSYVIRTAWQPRIGELGRLWAFDSSGHLITAAWPSLPSGKPQVQVQSVRIPEYIRQVELRLGVYASRFVTFTVKPKWISR